MAAATGDARGCSGGYQPPRTKWWLLPTSNLLHPVPRFPLPREYDHTPIADPRGPAACRHKSSNERRTSRRAPQLPGDGPPARAEKAGKRNRGPKACRACPEPGAWCAEVVQAKFLICKASRKKGPFPCSPVPVPRRHEKTAREGGLGEAVHSQWCRGAATGIAHAPRARLA